MTVSSGETSASFAFEGIGDYMSAMRNDLESGLAGETDDDARRTSENCFFMLRAYIRFLGNGLNEILPDSLKLCLGWRSAFLELAAHLHLYAESCGMGAWSGAVEKREARKRLLKDLKLCRNMASKVAEVLRDRELMEETRGRFLVFRDMRTKDIRAIWGLTDLGAYTDIYEDFEPRATKILDKLLDAYERQRSGEEGSDGGWCRAGGNWQTAFLKRGGAKAANGANRFKHDNIKVESRKDPDRRYNNVTFWRIIPDSASLREVTAPSRIRA